MEFWCHLHTGPFIINSLLPQPFIRCKCRSVRMCSGQWPEPGLLRIKTRSGSCSKPCLELQLVNCKYPLICRGSSPHWLQQSSQSAALQLQTLTNVRPRSLPPTHQYVASWWMRAHSSGFVTVMNYRLQRSRNNPWFCDGFCFSSANTNHWSTFRHVSNRCLFGMEGMTILEGASRKCLQVKAVST